MCGNRYRPSDVQMNMQRRRFLLSATGSAIVIALSACGSGGSSSDPTTGDTLPPVSTPPVSTPPATDVSASAYEHPTGADDVVFEYSELGGFTTREYSFQSPPVVLVSGDGRVFTTGPQTAIYPGQALPNIVVRTITEDGIQRLLTAAGDAGLFADIDYSAELNVADASTATVVVSVDGETWTHQAEALGLGADDASGGEATPEREALLAFTQQLGDLASLVGPDALGPEAPFEPADYLMLATVVDDPSQYASDDIEPTVVEWPATGPVRLADVAGSETMCTTISASDAGELFTAANQLTLFTEAGITYQVIPVQQLPGRTCP
jgi:hypothetical protein